MATQPQGTGTGKEQASATAPAKEATPAAGAAKKAETSVTPAAGTTKKAEASVTPAAGATKKAEASVTPAAGTTKKAEASVTPAAGGKQAYTLVPVPAPDKKTERLWKAKCSSCHGAKGKADTEKGAQMKLNDMTAASWQTARSNAQLRKAILEGGKTTAGGVTKEMDPFKDELKPEQVDQLIAFMRWVGAPK